MILGDVDLEYYIEEKKIIINPIKSDTIRENGLDLRIDKEIGIESKHYNKSHSIIDSHSIDDCKNRFEYGKTMTDFNNNIEFFEIESYSLNLLSTIEYIKLPNDIMGFCSLRSTVARHGFIAPITIVDAGFEGTLTIEVFYSGIKPIKLYCGDRFLHLILSKINSPVRKPYNGVYKGQKGVRFPKTID